MWVIKAEDAKCSSGTKIQTRKYRIKEPIMQNIHPEKDLEDIVGKSAKPSSQSRTALEKATRIYQVISSKGEDMRGEREAAPL